MAHSKEAPRDFIKNVFNPQIAVMTTHTVEQICKKNNLSFTEMVQPFCKMTGDTSFTDSAGEKVVVHKMKASLRDVTFSPPGPAVTEKFLSDTVREHHAAPMADAEQVHNLKRVPATVPWIDAWRESFMLLQPYFDHEAIKYYIGTVIVVSTADKNIEQTIKQMKLHITSMQSKTSNTFPKWFAPNAFVYYVILHDNVEGSSDAIHDCVTAVRSSFGLNNCYLLRINSRTHEEATPMEPDPWKPYSHIFKGSTLDSGPQTDDPQARTDFEFLPELETERPLPYHPLSPMHDEEPANANAQRSSVVDRDHHGMYLTPEDLERIKQFFFELFMKMIIPDMEKIFNSLSESLVNRKGVSKSLLNATKRWFTPKPGTSTSGDTATIVYPSNSTELNMRKLGDLYFMFGQYSSAFQLFHELKKDCHTDQAWLYYAGALEMAGISAFLLNQVDNKACAYLEEAVETYLSVCKMPHLACRAAILAAECMKGLDRFGEAAAQLIKMTSEESDLRSALFLEQAAYCFLHSSHPSMIRKYGFHVVLAGNRYSKAGQKEHALRCYQQAAEVYAGKDWCFAMDHIYHTIGKLAAQLGKLEDSVEAYSNLVRTCSKQPLSEQTLILKEYLLINVKNLERTDFHTVPVLPIPILQCETIKILAGPMAHLSPAGKVSAMGISLATNDDSKTAEKWYRLEDLLFQEAQPNAGMPFRPVTTLYSKDNISSITPSSVLNEPIHFCVTIINPLSFPLDLRNISLVWTFVNNKNLLELSDENGPKKSVLNHISSRVLVEANGKHDLILSLTPLTTGQLSVTGLFYTIYSASTNEQSLSVTGVQMFDLSKLPLLQTTAHEGVPVEVKAAEPLLEITFDDFNPNMLVNQIESIEVEMRNAGSVAVDAMYFATSRPDILSFYSCQQQRQIFAEIDGLENAQVREREARKNHVAQVALPSGKLEPGQSHTAQLWLRAPNVKTKGTALVDILIYYENTNSKALPRYRTSRHEWHLIIAESIGVTTKLTELMEPGGRHTYPLTVQITNLNWWYNNFVSKIKVTKTGFMSRYWVADDIQTTSPNSFGPQHSYRLLITLSKNKKLGVNLYRSKVSLADEIKQREYKLACFDYANRHIQYRVSAFDDVTPDFVWPQGAIIVQWEATISNKTGLQRQIRGQSEYQIDETVQAYFEGGRGRPVSTTSTHEIVHTFNFSHRVAVAASFRFSIYSNVDRTITILICEDKPKPEVAVDPRIYPPELPLQPSSTIQMVGPVQTVLELDEPNSPTTTLFLMAVCEPGTYNMAQLLNMYCNGESQNHLELAISVMQNSDD